RIGLDASDRKAVVADHFSPQAADIGLRAVRFLINQGESLEELVQWLPAAVEAFGAVGGGELADWRVTATQSSAPGSRRSLRRRGLSWTGRSRASWKACHWVSSRTNRRRSASACDAALTPASSRNSLTFLWHARAASCSSCLTGAVARTSMRSDLDGLAAAMARTSGERLR